MTTVGFEEVEVGVFDETTGDVTQTFVWKDENGGTVDLTITGLEPTISRVSASNKTVWQSKKGTGQVTSTFNTFNPPKEDLDIVLGRETDANGSSWVGEDTQAPNVAMIAKASAPDGTPVYFALTKGILGYNEIVINTKTSGEEQVPSNTTLTGSWQDREVDGKSRVFGTHVGEESYDTFRTSVFPGLATEPTT
jgi:phi13 family phage major tail protein